MRKFRIILLCVLVVNVAIALIASAKGILPCMVYRHGLTNEQMDEMVKKPEEKAKEKPTKTKTVKVHKPKKEGAGIFSIFWNTVVDGAIKVYDKANEEYKDQPANQE